MYGLINHITAADGRREELVDILLENARGMPGCLAYVVATDAEDPNGVWVTEVWDSEADQQASIELPSVKDAIKRAGPTIASFQPRTVTTPVGGQSLPET